MAGTDAGRYRLGHGSHDGGVRETGSAVLVQDPANGEGETAYCATVRTQRLGVGRRGLARVVERIAIDRLEPETSRGSASSASAGSAICRFTFAVCRILNK